MAGLGEEREESTKHTNEHVIKKMGPHSLQRLHEEGAYLKRRFLVPLPSQMEIGSVSPAPFSVVLSSSNKFSQCRLARKEKLQLGNDWVKKKHARGNSRCWSWPQFLKCFGSLLPGGSGGKGNSRYSSMALLQGFGGLQKPPRQTFMSPCDREPPQQARPQGAIETKGRSNSA